jgi:hypothetical protein
MIINSVCSRHLAIFSQTKLLRILLLQLDYKHLKRIKEPISKTSVTASVV